MVAHGLVRHRPVPLDQKHRVLLPDSNRAAGLVESPVGLDRVLYPVLGPVRWPDTVRVIVLH